MAYYANEENLNDEEFGTLTTAELADIEIDESALDNRHAEMLDDIYGEVQIAGMYFSASQVLSVLDPIAYRVDFHDWLDAEIQDGNIVEL